MLYSSYRCTSCRQELPGGAKVCSACGSFQGWRRHFSASTLILSLLIALFSVLGTVIPIIKAALTPARSRVQISFHKLTRKAVVLVATNQGSRPAVVQSAQFRAFDAEGKEQSVLELRLPEDSESLVVNPGKLVIVSATPTASGAQAPFPVLASTYRCEVHISAIAFDHEPNISPVEIPCLTGGP